MDLTFNSEITITGWDAFSAVFQNPDSELEELSLSSNRFNDGTLVSLAPSLANNNKLKKLFLGFDTNITVKGWTALSYVLCNTSSIMDTFHSNHMLQILCEGYDEDQLPGDIMSLLRLNRENGKS